MQSLGVEELGFEEKSQGSNSLHAVWIPMENLFLTVGFPLTGQLGNSIHPWYLYSNPKVRGGGIKPFRSLMR